MVILVRLGISNVGNHQVFTTGKPTIVYRMKERTTFINFVLRTREQRTSILRSVSVGFWLMRDLYDVENDSEEQRIYKRSQSLYIREQSINICLTKYFYLFTPGELKLLRPSKNT